MERLPCHPFIMASSSSGVAVTMSSRRSPSKYLIPSTVSMDSEEGSGVEEETVRVEGVREDLDRESTSDWGVSSAGEEVEEEEEVVEEEVVEVDEVKEEEEGEEAKELLRDPKDIEEVEDGVPGPRSSSLPPIPTSPAMSP